MAAGTHTYARPAITETRVHYSCGRPTGVARSARRRGDVMGGCAVGRQAGCHAFVHQAFVHTPASATILSVRCWTKSADRLSLLLRCAPCCVMVTVVSALEARHRVFNRDSGQRLYCAGCNVHDLQPSDRAISI